MVVAPLHLGRSPRPCRLSTGCPLCTVVGVRRHLDQVGSIASPSISPWRTCRSSSSFGLSWTGTERTQLSSHRGGTTSARNSCVVPAQPSWLDPRYEHRRRRSRKTVLMPGTTFIFFRVAFFLRVGRATRHVPRFCTCLITTGVL